MANLLSSLKNKGFSSIGSIAGVGLLVATPLVAMTMIALVIAQRGSIRADFGLGGGSTAGLEKVASNITLYVTTYYPGNGNQSVEGDCQTAAGEDNGPRGNFFYLKSSTGEIVDYCKKSSSEKLAMINDNDYQLISVFSADNQRYAFGGVAVNNNSWPGGTPFPIYGRVNNVRNGHTYWLEIPGLEGLTPVVDHFGSATGNNKAAQNRMLKQGKDMRYRVDIAIKAAGDSDSAHIDPFLQKIGCDRSEGAGGVFTCSVKGVNVFFGNPFESNSTVSGGPASGPSTEAEGNYTGPASLGVIQKRFPANLFGGEKINTYYARPTYIVLHYLGEKGNGQPMTVNEAWNYFKGTVSDNNGSDNKYVQFLIGQDGKIVQALAETKQAAGACGFNRTPDGVGVSISIENEGNFEMSAPALQYTTAQVEANAQLIQYLINKWRIPKSHVVSHEWVYQNYGRSAGCDGRSDPGESFMNAVKSKLTEPQ